MAPQAANYLPEAADELIAAQGWYAKRSIDAAARFTLAIDQAIEQIVAAPSRWRRYLYGTRRYVLQDFPYVIVNYETADLIWIVALAHAARRPGYWKRRSKKWGGGRTGASR